MESDAFKFKGFSTLPHSLSPPKRKTRKVDGDLTPARTSIRQYTGPSLFNCEGHAFEEDDLVPSIRKLHRELEESRANLKELEYKVTETRKAMSNLEDNLAALMDAKYKQIEVKSFTLHNAT